jgi:hypothetical protein
MSTNGLMFSLYVWWSRPAGKQAHEMPIKPSHDMVAEEEEKRSCRLPGRRPSFSLNIEGPACDQKPLNMSSAKDRSSIGLFGSSSDSLRISKLLGSPSCSSAGLCGASAFPAQLKEWQTKREQDQLPCMVILVARDAFFCTFPTSSHPPRPSM